jgi:hypothetical protein
MQTIQIYLPDVAAVQKFVETIAPLDGDFVLEVGNRILDARSLMGILTFDLSQPLKLTIGDNRILAAIQPFLWEKGE